MLCKVDIFVIVLDNLLTCSIHVEIIIHVHDNCSELKTKATLQSYEVKHGQPLTCYTFTCAFKLNTE